MSRVNVRRSAFRSISSASPGSWIGTSPRCSASTFSGDDLAHDDAVAQLGEAGSGDQADPAGADHPYRLSFAHAG